eukprot:5057751-Pyramimonas_sp.AAC.1
MSIFGTLSEIMSERFPESANTSGCRLRGARGPMSPELCIARCAAAFCLNLRPLGSQKQMFEYPRPIATHASLWLGRR